METAPLVEALPALLRTHSQDPVVTSLLTDDLELQVEIDGRPVRIPTDRNGNPAFGGELFSQERLLLVLGLVGTTGWRWRAKETSFVILDYDAENHADGHSAETLALVIEAARKAGYVWVRHSKSGKGIHLIVLCQPLPAPTGAHHTHNINAIINQLCADADFDFRKYICSNQLGFFWAPGELPTNAFKVLAPPTCEPPVVEVPPFEPPEAKPDSEFTESHKRDIDTMRSAGYVANIVDNRLVAHTKGFEFLVQATARVCKYGTVSPGQKPQEPNCWAYPTNDGGWNVTRFNVPADKETGCWHANAAGFASTNIPPPPDEEALQPTALPGSVSAPTPLSEPVPAPAPVPGPAPVPDPAPERASKPKQDRPTIQVTHELASVVGQAIGALRNRPNVYQRGCLVEMVFDAKKPKLCLQENGGPKLRPIPFATVRVRLSAAAKWQKWSQRGAEWVACAPPNAIVAAVSNSAAFPGIPVATGVVSGPVLRSDGSIAASPGYDKLTGLHLDIDGEYPRLPPVKEAVGALKEVFVDFPFATEAHRSACFATLLTLMARAAFKGPAPFFLFDANITRIGKGLLTDVITMIHEGRKAARSDVSHSTDEMQKFITSVAISGIDYVLFDNLKGRFGGPAIEGALTAGRWSGRVLGRNSTVDLPMNVVWMGTSNNAILTGDMIGRTLHIRMHTDNEHPELRIGFAHPDLLTYVKHTRKKLAMAALSIMAKWIEAGKPDQKLDAWGGFEEWSNLIRNSLVWAGLPDPGETRKALAAEADDENALLRQIMAGWAELNGPSTVGAAYQAANSNKAPILKEVFDELPGDPRIALGQILKHARGRAVGGKKFERTNTTLPRWRLVEVKA